MKPSVTLQQGFILALRLKQNPCVTWQARPTVRITFGARDTGGRGLGTKMYRTPSSLTLRILHLIH